MKSICQHIVFVIAFVSLATAHAVNPREELKQLAAQIQSNPNDTALREKIIKLGARIRPVVPEEANRAFVRGGVFLKEAKDASGYDLAIAAFREVLVQAPWWGDAYYNLAVALESARKFDEAIASIKLYMASVPAGSAEAREAQNRIYALEAKRELAAKQASAAQVERSRPSVEGKWTISGMFDFQVVRYGESFMIIGEKRFGKSGGWRATNVVLDPQHIRFSVQQTDCPQCGSGRYDLSLSPSGNELTGTLQHSDGRSEKSAPITRVP